MNLTLMRLISAGSWSVDLSTLLEYQGIARAIMNGATFNLPTIPVPDSYLFDTATGLMSEQSEQNTTQDENAQLIAVHSVVGMMLKYDTECGPIGTRTIGKRILHADKNPNVVAHVVVYDSGGGQSISVKPLKEAMQKTAKPIVAYADDVMCSAAYGSAIYAKEIMASPDANIGSIGTFISLEGYPLHSTEEDGYIRVRVYADSSPDKNAEYEEALKGNFSLIKQNILNSHDADFMEAVKAARPKASEKHLAGGTWRGDQLVGTLVDSLGSLDDAIQRAYELAKKSNQNSLNQNTMKKTYANIGVAAGLADPIEVEESAGLHLQTENADMLEAQLADYKQLVKDQSDLPEGKTVQDLLDQITQLETDNTQAVEALQKDFDQKESDFKTQITGLQQDLQQANQVIADKETEIESLSKTPPAAETGVTTTDDAGGEPQKPVDAEANYYYQLSLVGKKNN